MIVQLSHRHSIVNAMAAHLTDWFCPWCRRWNAWKSKACGKCARVLLTRAVFSRKHKRRQVAENRTREILKRFGL